MDAGFIQDRIARGLGAAARKIGTPCTVYRPKGPMNPISPRHAMIELAASFRAEGHGPAHSPGYNTPLWTGIFDSSYTIPGDYLVGVTGTYFVASQIPTLPIQCVLANTCVTVVRPLPAATGGYSGLYGSQGEAVIIDWPAAIMAMGNHATTSLHNDSYLGGWLVLLPQMPFSFKANDVISDGQGASYVVASANNSNLGWRIVARQVGA